MLIDGHQHQTHAQEVEPLVSSDDEEIDFNFNEEQSVFSYLMDEGPKPSDEDRLDALVDSLKGPFQDKGGQLKKDVACSIAPAIRMVSKAHHVLQTKVDTDYVKGIATFNSACRNIEAVSLAEYEELTESYEKTRANLANLMKQLKAEYAHRDSLWADLERKIDEIADPALAELEDLPAQIERIIAKLDRAYDTMQNQNKDSSVFSEKKIRDLLSKFGESSLYDC
ncbi:hypothetical protein FA15DRAFT_684438 [Coprinopsis marcescibilis]|uniref:Uncharacterized protein n=1 Tax=Coprinopsis marcescibilis TaxID=230819 RepID=A0A5C3LE39_COPMA|nr:hypothetical protein FA15DRAFT_684438 [Coprinopsis marcescibilis]